MAKDQQFPTGFGRAIQMLSLAIQHVLYGKLDAARTNLRASWSGLKDSTVGRIEHMATTAFVNAVSGNIQHSVRVLEATMAELDLRRYELPPTIRAWVWECCVQTMQHLPYAATINKLIGDAYWECCVQTMQHLPYAATINKLIGDAYAHSTIGDYAEALHLLTQANSQLEQGRHLVPPQVTNNLSVAWGDILERMLCDETVSTRDCVQRYTIRMTQLQPTAA